MELWTWDEQAVSSGWFVCLLNSWFLNLIGKVLEMDHWVSSNIFVSLWFISDSSELFLNEKLHLRLKRFIDQNVFQSSSAIPFSSERAPSFPLRSAGSRWLTVMIGGESWVRMRVSLQLELVIPQVMEVALTQIQCCLLFSAGSINCTPGWTESGGR